jgi:hypothetical protein
MQYQGPLLSIIALANNMGLKYVDPNDIDRLRTADGQPDIQGFWQTQGGGLTVSLEKGGVTLLDSDKVSFSDTASSVRSARHSLIGGFDHGLVAIRRSGSEHRSTQPGHGGRAYR